MAWLNRTPFEIEQVCVREARERYTLAVKREIVVGTLLVPGSIAALVLVRSRAEIAPRFATRPNSC